MAKKCPHCDMAPCIGGKGPGSCMSGSRGKNVPTPRSRGQQNKDEAPKEHISNWRRVGSVNLKTGVKTSFTCTKCGTMRVVDGSNEPPDERHKDRR